MLTAFILWSAVALALVCIGVSCLRAKKPVGFFTGVEPPKVSDVARYNRAISRLWFFYACVFEIIGLPLLQTAQNSPLVVFVVLAALLWAIALAVTYTKIEERYKQ
ncbi:MAG: hypothetical protein IJ769_12360 [Clostridia bacterium]|nr:hypothetical protein [Clostridia bacterium]